MKVLITGSNGFIGKNLKIWLQERPDIEVVPYIREDSINDLSELVSNVDFVYHLAGVNRPTDEADFAIGNTDLTKELCDAIAEATKQKGRSIPVVFASSTQASANNLYGKSKRAAELAMFELAKSVNTAVHVFRLPNIFGKWCKPNYNSVVATFCHNIAHELPISIHDETAPLTLLHVDDLITRFIQLLDGADDVRDEQGFSIVQPQYTTTVGALAEHLRRFKDTRNTLITERVGNGFMRALYSTFISYLPTSDFSYMLPTHGDDRGTFVEMLKTRDSGQFSFFSAHAGVTRGQHYHHCKTEKFLIIQGKARFRFQQIDTGETYELVTSDERFEIVDTVPGWAHDITNIGDKELIVMLWANEIYDHARPDTFPFPLNG